MIAEYLKEKRELIDTQLSVVLPDRTIEPTVIHEAMYYSVFAGGKRLRPVLVIAAGETLGVDESYLIEPACAIECIHTYSLIHDDLPCIDNDDLRRGKPTSHKVFGEAIAVLAGDALLTWAFHILACCKAAQEKPYTGVKIIECVSKAVSTYGMVGGQVLDISYEKKKVSAKEIMKMEFMKTANLIQASVMIPALIADVPEEWYRALSIYGKNIGLAFQIVDDLLDIKGSKENMGKATQKDIMAEKATLPSLVGYKAALKRARHYSKTAQDAVALCDKKNLLAEIAEFLIQRTY